jgi:hypothetical protein
VLPFLPFPKIPDDSVPGDAVVTRRLGRARWTVTEKVHGAHLCAGTAGRALRIGTRKRWLVEGDEFFGWERLDLGGALHALWLRLASPGERLVVFGELCGGGYPHPDVEPDVTLAPVQTGAWYCPGLAWLPFDVALVGSTGEVRWLADETWRQPAVGVGLVPVPLLASCPEAEALSWPVDFDTEVPELLGLPPLKPNAAEGVVIKPAVDLADRPVSVKRKRPDLREDQRWHRATRWDAPEHRDLLARAQWESEQRICRPRTDNVVSKYGPYLRRSDHRDEASRLVAEDVLAEVLALPGLSALTGRQVAALERHVHRRARDHLDGLASDDPAAP